MNIALFGYGKMGKTIEELALAAGDEIVLRIDIDNRHQITKEQLKAAHVAIEFSRPESAFENIVFCLEAGVPVVAGTTGWLDKMDVVKALCAKHDGAFLYASNFSLGVNIFFALNKHLAHIMKQFPDYHPDLLEIHHTQKLDAPSGTAITLAEGVMAAYPQYKGWVNDLESNDASNLFIESQRITDVPGTHEVNYRSDEDHISIKHIAHNRLGFAKGALLAARWLQDKKGFFGMSDVLGF